MKTTILKSAFFMALTAGFLSSCVKDDNYGTPELTGCTKTSLVKNREVSQITATSIISQHVNIVPGVSDVIEAYVTSSDIGGNFFKSISFQTKDGANAFSIPVDATSTFINYPPGAKVLINMDGLYTDVKYGGIRIGGLYGNSSGGAEVGRLALADFTKSVQPSCTVINEDELLPAIPVTIDQAKTDAYLNKLIEFNNVEFAPSEIGNTTYYDPNPSNPNTVGGATNRNLIDITGNAVIVRTSSYANFASKSVATGSGKVRGVMTKYGTTYQFMPRSLSDIKLTGARFTPLLNEAFESGSIPLNWIAYSVTGPQVWTYSSTFGNPGGMMKMSGYTNPSYNANEDWLISPAQDLSTLSSATLSFDNAYKYSGDPIKVLVSNNYSGAGNPNLATWTVLTPTLSAGNFVYVNSGNLNINAFTGSGNTNVYVAFKYTSGASSANNSTWEIDNVKITGN